jgi:hypothetical protein
MHGIVDIRICCTFPVNPSRCVSHERDTRVEEEEALQPLPQTHVSARMWVVDQLEVHGHPVARMERIPAAERAPTDGPLVHSLPRAN